MIKKLYSGFKIFCGYLTVYISVGGLIGFLIAKTGYNEDKVCWPQNSTFAALVIECKSLYSEIAWSLVVVIPRIFIVAPVMPLAQFKAAMKNLHGSFYDHLIEGLILIVIVSPVLLLYIFGFIYWKKISTPFANTILLLICAQILYLAHVF